MSNPFSFIMAGRGLATNDVDALADVILQDMATAYTPAAYDGRKPVSEALRLLAIRYPGTGAYAYFSRLLEFQIRQEAKILG